MPDFDRVYKVDIDLINRDGIQTGTIKNIRNLKAAFQVTKTLSWASNKATIQIYNLSQDKRNKLRDFGDLIKLHAGYSQANSEQLLFIGSSTKVSHLYQNPDIVTSINCSEGERDLIQQFVELSFSGEVAIKKIIRSIADKIGISIAFFADVDDVVYKNGYQISDYAREPLSDLSKRLGVTFTLQNGELYFIEKGKGTTKPAITINENNGMISVPERYANKELDRYRTAPAKGWIVKTVLRPEIIPGQRVNLQSKRADIDGVFYVDSVIHTGDTHGNEWRSEFKVLEI